MRKVEYINRLIIFNHLKESDRDIYMTKDIYELMQLYIMVINKRIKENEKEI